MAEGTARRLPLTFSASAGIGRLALVDPAAGPLIVERLELEVTDLGTDPGIVLAERFQRRRTRLRSLTVRAPAAALTARVAEVKRHLAGLGITQLSARLHDGFVSVRARASDGLAAADVSFRIQLASAGPHLRALATTVRVLGHLPTPGPIIADRILAAVLGATETAGILERPHARGLCDVEIDLVGALLWNLMPPAGWRLPATTDVELVHVKIGRTAIEIGYGPTGSRSGDLGVRPVALQLAAAHDLMHSADQQLRDGHLEDTMRGYRALLAAGGPDQPLLLERILALAAARPPWFHDGLELARQALGRWPQFAAANAALASITLAQGDAREAASHLTTLANLASAEGDDDQAALAALAGARLLRVLEPKAATLLYQLALEHDPGSAEAADALADRFADEQRWVELVRLLRARAGASEAERAVQLRLRLADVLAHNADDPLGAQQELPAARALAPDDPAVHEMTATILQGRASVDAWREVARLAEARGDHRTAARAFATLGGALVATDAATAQAAWRRALELDPLQADAIAVLAAAAATAGDHARAAELYERLRGLGLAQGVAARHELHLARSLVVLGRTDDARGSLRRATLAGGETAAEAHAVLAEIAEATLDREHAAAELDTAIGSLVDLAAEEAVPRVTDSIGPASGLERSTRLRVRAAELAVARATLFDRSGQISLATADYERAHELAQDHSPAIARDAARTMLGRVQDDGARERRWIDAVLATRPPAAERAGLLVQRADVRRRERTPDLAAALADLHEALHLTEDDPASTEVRRHAYQLEVELFAKSGDRRARAQALAALAKMAERAQDRVEIETAAAAAWLAADEPASALPHGARAHASVDQMADVPAALRREVLSTLGEAAWRQRAWPDVIRAYKGLVDDPGAEAPRMGTFRYRLAVAADRSGDPKLALVALAPLVNEPTSEGNLASSTTPETRGQALRLFADLAERAGDLAGAATALEGFATLAVDSSSSARADAMYRAGELFRRSSRADDAVRCLEAALKISETHLPALDALELAWRERGDIERVSVILGRKVAATTRHPGRQKPLLSRLGDLQDQLGRPDVALATHQRALEIDPLWRPSLRYVTLHLRDGGQATTAAGGLAQLAGDLPGDGGVDPAVAARERHEAAQALASLVLGLDDGALDAIRDVSRPALERAAPPRASTWRPGSGACAATRRSRPSRDRAPRRTPRAAATRARRAVRCRCATPRPRARAAGKPADAFASLEAANHVNPGDAEVLRELIELANELDDTTAAATHASTLADLLSGPRRGDALIELADICYDRLGDAVRARAAMRAAADAYGPGRRREATLRMLASEAASHLAWDVTVDALDAVAPDRRTAPDITQLAAALQRAGRDADAVAVVEEAQANARYDDGGVLVAQLRAEIVRKTALAEKLEATAKTDGESTLHAEAVQLWHAVGRAGTAPILAELDEPPAPPEPPSVKIDATPAEAAKAVAAAAASADRDRLVAAHVAHPDDAGVLLALLAHLGDKESDLRREALERSASSGAGRARAIALHELAAFARTRDQDPVRAASLWSEAHRADASYAPVWMPLADAFVAADDMIAARDLYERVASSDEYDDARRAWAADRAEALSFDASIVSGEIRMPPPGIHPELTRAHELADKGDWAAAIGAAERAANVSDDVGALELLERLYLEVGDITAASEAIGRQLVVRTEVGDRAALWRRRAKIYRDALGREAEAYRCLKEAHAASPADPEVAYQLRTAAMVRGEHALAASLLYREIAGSTNPRDRGALHLELALIYDERLDDPTQAQVNYEQALAFDPTIPAAKVPLAKRYEALGRYADAAKLYDTAAGAARPAERQLLVDAAKRCRDAEAHAEPDLAVQIERASTAGDLDATADLSHQLWRTDPGHPTAFRVLAGVKKASGDLPGLTELTTVRATRADSDERASLWLEVARLAEETGALDQAARAFDLALIEDPGHIGALDARGALAFRLGDLATADLIYRDLAPGESVLGDDELAHRRSLIAEKLGRDGEALAHAQNAAETGPGRRELLQRVQELATRTGDLHIALDAARRVLDLVPLDDDSAQIATGFELVELMRAAGDLDGAVYQLERIIRDFPQHAHALEQLVEVHVGRSDWASATRYLYMLVPLAPTPAARADRLYRLGEAVLVHLGDIDRADDVFLRASDLDPGHVPTLRRLLDVYWRADDPAALVEVATELVSTGALSRGQPIDRSSLAQALVAAALLGDTKLATSLRDALGEATPASLAAALGELATRDGRLALGSASTAIAELGRRGIVDLATLRAAAAGTPVATALT